jgi:hypothetical protein
MSPSHMNSPTVPPPPPTPRWSSLPPSNFIINGNPNVGVTPPVAWPTWDPTTRSELLLQTGAPVTFNSTGLCEFWDSVGSPPYKCVQFHCF